MGSMNALQEKVLKSIEGVRSELERTPYNAHRDESVEWFYKGLWFAEERRPQEAVEAYEQALKLREPFPEAWFTKGVALLQLDKPKDALKSFQKALDFRQHLQLFEREMLPEMYKAWAISALFFALDGLMNSRGADAKEGVSHFLQARELVTEDGLDELAKELNRFATSREGPPGSEQEEAAFEEIELMIKLLSIKDPFDRWRVFTKEISKVWPEGVSAVDEIREQRDRWWNRSS